MFFFFFLEEMMKSTLRKKVAKNLKSNISHAHRKTLLKHEKKEPAQPLNAETKMRRVYMQLAQTFARSQKEL